MNVRATKTPAQVNATLIPRGASHLPTHPLGE